MLIFDCCWIFCHSIPKKALQWQNLLFKPKPGLQKPLRPMLKCTKAFIKNFRPIFSTLLPRLYHMWPFFWQLSGSAIKLNSDKTIGHYLGYTCSAVLPDPVFATLSVILFAVIASFLLTLNVAQQDYAWHHLKVPSESSPAPPPLLPSSII